MQSSTFAAYRQPRLQRAQEGRRFARESSPPALIGTRWSISVYVPRNTRTRGRSGKDRLPHRLPAFCRDGGGIDGGDGAYAETLTGGTGRDVLSTGYGDDTINARSAIPWVYSDTDASISCGSGEDTVYADRSDPISAGQNGCEHVFKP
jgi:RTX calcium-binding nonapeptide repeat (4 copies)